MTSDIGAKLLANAESIAALRTELEQMGHQMSEIRAFQTGIAGAVEEQQAASASLAHTVGAAVDHHHEQ